MFLFHHSSVPDLSFDLSYLGRCHSVVLWACGSCCATTVITQMPVMTCLLQSNSVASLFALIINISSAQPIELELLNEVIQKLVM